ncbi:hypothetical protein CY35_10G005600 [Sphagnum magellanicum]|nr:hypothetical protein CY35_10G005600 [Sphagnum magellanicum]
MLGPNMNDQAMQRILNKEGVEKGTPSLQKTPREKLDKASRPCKSGPGHAEQTKPFYSKNLDQVQKFTPCSQDDL